MISWVKQLERGEGSPRARRRCRPAGSAWAWAWAWAWVKGLWPDKNYSFWTKLSSTFCHLFWEKTAYNFILKRQVVCLENKNAMHVILREILAHVQQLLREVDRLRLFKYRLSSPFISELFHCKIPAKTPMRKSRECFVDY